MAGGGESVDNPVGINVVPMVDVIFCLCVFFLCSFQIQAGEGRFASWLPKDLGNGPASVVEPREMRVALFWDEFRGSVSRHYGLREVAGEDELEALLAGSLRDGIALGAARAPLVVDGDPRVPWREVVAVMNIGRRIGVQDIQLASHTEDR